MYLSEEHPVRDSQLQDLGEDWMMSVLTYPSNLSEFLLKNGPAGSSGKMFRGLLLANQVKQQTKKEKSKTEVAQTSQGLFQLSPDEILPTRILKKPVASKVNFTLSHGAYLIANISECHRDAEESLLSDILEKTGDHLLRYCLSKTACAGILRRAERRGKELPGIPKQALEEIASGGGYRQRGFGDYADDDSASALKKRDYKDATDLVVIENISNEPTASTITKQLCKQSGQDLGATGMLVVATAEDKPFTLGGFANYKEGIGTLKKNGGDLGGQRNDNSDEEIKVQSIDCRNSILNDEISGTLQSKKSGGYSLNYINPVIIHEDTSI